MQACYADGAVFNDNVFSDLDARQVRLMWQMLIERGKDLDIEFRNIEANSSMGSAEWTASYTFSSSHRKVVNHIHSNFLFDSGKIVHHSDTFDFYAWARQALGLKGLLLGWTAFFRRSVQAQAKKSLRKYISAHQEP